MSDKILEVKNLFYDVVRYDHKKNILNDVSFELYKNQITTIIGPNGAGKSTLVQLILGLLKPTKGTIKKHKKLRIGYVPQTLKINTYLPLTVGDFFNLYTMPSDQLLEKLAIKHLLDQSFHLLSGGEKQRVLFANALAIKPNFLVLDEPTQGVDIVGQKDFFHLMLNFKKEYQYTVFLISHDMHAVLAASDQIICLNGHICCSGHPDDVEKHEEYKKITGHKEIAPYEFTTYKHEHDHCHDHICDHQEHS